MRCTPTQQKTRLVYGLIGCLLALGGIAYAIPIACEARGIAISGLLFSALSIFSFVGGIWVLVRYQMTTFTYLIRPRSDIAENGMEAAYAEARDLTRMPPAWLDLVVLKGQGSRAQAMECVLSLGDLVEVIPVAEEAVKALRDRYRRENPRAFTYYDYTLTPRPDNAITLIFADGDAFVGIVLEPDPAMRAYLLGLV